VVNYTQTEGRKVKAHHHHLGTFRRGAESGRDTVVIFELRPQFFILNFEACWQCNVKEDRGVRSSDGSSAQYSQKMLTWNSKDAPTNPRGIPYAPFVDKVEDYVVSRAEVDGTMKSFQEMISYALIIQ